MTLRFLAVILLCGAVAAPAADAKLRSPHLESSCADGFHYGEATFGGFIVEGCNKSGTLQGDETIRTIYQGVVELNGMLVKGSANLIATEGKSSVAGSTHSFDRVTRDNGKLVLDPKIGGERRLLQIYDGDVDFELNLGLSKSETVDIHRRGAHTASLINGGTIDIPIGSDAKILGMRLGGTVHDAEISAADGGSITFTPRMRMGETASALLRDWEAKVKVETVDGVGMKIDNLKFAIPNIEVPGIGGFKNLHVTYSGAQDEWSGGVDIDLGDIFPSISFDMSIDATTGAPTAIQLDVSPFNVALGPTGVFLQGLRGGFDVNPMVLNSGVTLSAGPEYGGVGLVEVNADTRIQLEPYFRMENTGNARFLPVGSSTQVAKGQAHLTLDSRGYLSIGADARWEVSLLDVGIAAQIEGSGAYSTISDAFDFEASATGSLLLGPLGEADILKYAAVVSSNGWGTCGNVFLFVKAGVGQQWDGNVKLLMGCDLSQFDARVPDPGRRAAGDRAQTFAVARGTKQLAVEITADGPEPRVALTGPGGAVAATVPAQKYRAVGQDTVVIAPPGSATQYLFLRNPKAGRYTLRWAAEGGQVTGVRFARDVAPLSAKVRVLRDAKHAGRRRLAVSALKGLATGERVRLGVRTPAGIMPVDGSFEETQTGRQEIVGMIERDGIPIPGRTRVLGHYIASLPARPAKLKVVRHRHRRVALLARARHGAELPDAWQYVLRAHGRPFALRRARPGRPALFQIPTDVPNDLSITVRPVIGGKVSTGKALVKHLTSL